MFKKFIDFSVFSLHNRYIPALTLIALFSAMAYKNVNDIMISINDDGKIINISGRQRMLSQKLVIDAKNYLVLQSPESKKQLNKTIKLMENSHHFLLNRELSKQLKDIYYSKGLHKQIINYLTEFKELINTKDQKQLNYLRLHSNEILIKLDHAVQIYENENITKMQKLKVREDYIFLLTIMALLFEAVFIFYPAAKKIKENKEELKAQIKLRTNELQNSIDIIDKNVIYSRTDLKGIITYASKAFCTISGYSNDELIGKPHNIVRHLDMPKSAFKDLWETIEKGKEWVGEVKNLKKNGDFYWVEAHISPEYDLQGNRIGYAAIRHNITDKKTLEKLNTNLEQKIQKEITKNRQKDQKIFENEKRSQISEMIGNIAHQWRQPLNMISTCAGGIQLKQEHGLLDEKSLKEDTDKIVKTTKDLSNTIDSFSSFLSSNNHKERLNIKDFLEGLKNIVQDNLHDNGINLLLDIPDKNLEINTIKSDLTTVLLHIIYNSKDILLERGIEKGFLKLSAQKENDNVVAIKIEDNGKGIDDKIIGKIFDPYFTTKHQSQGTGMGLYICQIIVSKRLEGYISVTNTLKGAKFIINLNNLT